MARCFVTRSLPGSALDRLACEHEVDLWPGRLPPQRHELAARLRDAEGLLCLLTDGVDRELIEGAPRLRVVASYSVGSDNVDLDAAAEHGIAVGVTPDVLTDATADMAFALLLAAARRVVEADAAARSGGWRTWEPAYLLGREVHRRTLGVVGAGRIGSAVARRAEGFDMEVIISARRSGVPLEELLAKADFVSLHVPLTVETDGLIGERELGLMRSDAILVNTARGAIVDNVALAAALREGRIAAAALDVTDPEPPPTGHPILEAPNVTLAPHIGSATRVARERMADLAVDNLLAGLAGRPLPAPASG